jgi:hypothetical protein
MSRLFLSNAIMMSPWKLTLYFVVIVHLLGWSRALLCPLYKPQAVVLLFATLDVSIELVFDQVVDRTLGFLGCRALLVTN